MTPIINHFLPLLAPFADFAFLALPLALALGLGLALDFVFFAFEVYLTFFDSLVFLAIFFVFVGFLASVFLTYTFSVVLGLDLLFFSSTLTAGFNAGFYGFFLFSASLFFFSAY